MFKIIVLVEDDVVIRENYLVVLCVQGYYVDVYEDRFSVLCVFNVNLFDFVIIDIGLKEEMEGGFLLCQ